MDAAGEWDTLDPDDPPVLRWLRPPDGDRVALLLGAFDPPTNAHVELVRGAARALGRAPALCATKVLLGRPAPVLVPPRERIELLAEVASEAGLGLAAANRGTYLEVGGACDHDAVFVVGSDKLRRLRDPSFYPDGEAGVQETFRTVRFAVVRRAGWEADQPGLVVLEPEDVFADTSMAGVSATEVRRRLAAGEGIEGLVPAVVASRVRRYTRNPSRHR